MTSSWGGSRYAPNVFTEQGVYMLMTILKGELAAKRFMQSFVDRIELYPERRKDGNWIKNILFNFSIPIVREDEELARIGGISLENSTLSNVDLPLEKLSTHEMVVFLCERDQNLQFVNIKNPRIHGHYSPGDCEFGSRISLKGMSLSFSIVKQEFPGHRLGNSFSKRTMEVLHYRSDKLRIEGLTIP